MIGVIYVVPYTAWPSLAPPCSAFYLVTDAILGCRRIHIPHYSAACRPFGIIIQRCQCAFSLVAGFQRLRAVMV